MKKLIGWLFRDSRNFWDLLARLGWLNPETAAALGVAPYPYYHFGLMQACSEARHLGFKEIYALEFGVAGGRGLTQMLKAARRLGSAYGVKVHVLGFDLGSGMPAPLDVRDAQYLWATGDFPMDEESLRSALLSEAQVLLGPVSDSVAVFEKGGVDRNSNSNETVKLLFPELGLDSTIPIGFISFDLDYYSSTIQALEILRVARTLPRVWAYFDDINLISHQHGELLAIDEWNSKEEKIYISLINLGYPIWVNWGHQMRLIHFYDHPKYNVRLHNGVAQLPL